MEVVSDGVACTGVAGGRKLGVSAMISGVIFMFCSRKVCSAKGHSSSFLLHGEQSSVRQEKLGTLHSLVSVSSSQVHFNHRIRQNPTRSSQWRGGLA